MVKVLCLPDGLVGNDNLSPLLLGELGGDGVELVGNDIEGLVGLALLYDGQWTIYAESR